MCAFKSATTKRLQLKSDLLLFPEQSVCVCVFVRMKKIT
jgi:hypothetical protein